MLIDDCLLEARAAICGLRMHTNHSALCPQFVMWSKQLRHLCSVVCCVLFVMRKCTLCVHRSVHVISPGTTTTYLAMSPRSRDHVHGNIYKVNIS